MASTPDPMPHARESASEVLRELQFDGVGTCPICNGLDPKQYSGFNGHIAARIGHTSDCRLAAALTDSTPAPSGDDVAELRAENERLRADNLRFIRINGELRERLTDCEKRIGYQRRVLAGNLSGRRAALARSTQDEGESRV